MASHRTIDDVAPNLREEFFTGCHLIDLGRLTEGFYDTALNEASDT